MDSVLSQLFLLALLVSLNSVFALVEIAVVSARKARLQQLASEGNKGASAALELANNPTDFLSTIQIGITLVGILTGAFSASSLIDDVAAYFKEFDALKDIAFPLASTVVLGASTYLTIVFGELIPKRIAMGNAERISSLLARPTFALTRIAMPLVRLLSWSTDKMLRVLGIAPSNDPPVTEEEVKILIEQGTIAGVFKKTEEVIFKRVLKLGDQIVGDLMTTRVKMVALDIDEPLEKNIRKMLGSPHSYFPVYQRNLDNVQGMVSIKLLWAQLVKQRNVNSLKDCMLKPLFMPESMAALRALELFKQSGRHIALVVDEYGGTAGIITVVDIFKAIVGSLPSADEKLPAAARQREDGSWLIDGMISIEELKEVLQIPHIEGENLGDYQTLGGFFMAKTGKIPKEGQYFSWDNFRFEVVDMDGLRIDKVLVSKNKKTVSTIEKS